MTASSTRPTPQRLRPLDRRVPNTVLHMTGVALLFAGVGMFVCLLVELMVAGSEELALLVSGILTCSAGFGIWRTTRVGEVKPATIFYAVAVTWITLSLAGTLPYLLSGTITRFDDALFESISGFTCTGSTILTFIEGNSRGVLFWRQMTQWFGGMGVIVLAVAV
ncbi:MAG: potassium transporter TrkG, partial [Acidimicrobiales bacterium]